MNIYAKNKKALHDYIIVNSLESGLSLKGQEVKQIRQSNIQLKGSYVTIKNNQIFLIGAHISRPNGLNHNEYFDENRDISLLVNKKQFYEIKKFNNESGNSLVVLKIYEPNDSKKIKAELSMVKGKKEYDKRETLKRKQQEIDIKRELKGY